MKGVPMSMIATSPRKFALEAESTLANTPQEEYDARRKAIMASAYAQFDSGSAREINDSLRDTPEPRLVAQ